MGIRSHLARILVALLISAASARAETYLNGVLQPPPLTAAAAAAAAPVQSVNGVTGAVSVPTNCRQQTATPLAIPQTNPGLVSWTFPNPTCSFATPPSCWSDISTTTSGFVFDGPLNIARSTSAVTYSYTSHASTLNITVGALNVTLAPPANSTVILTCTAPPA